MISIIKKEVRYFFSSGIGWVLILFFSLFNTLFLWILAGQYNIINSGFADLNSFFQLSSWIFVFLIPAISMRAISEEKKTGTLHLLLTFPISEFKIILSKYISIFLFILILLLPSLLNLFIIQNLMIDGQWLEFGVIFGSYVALILLGMTFGSVGLWASCIAQNQIISFIIALILNFLFFYGIDEIFSLFEFKTNFYFGFKSHFEDISRGVIDSRNLLYFVLFISFFLYLSTRYLKSEKL